LCLEAYHGGKTSGAFADGMVGVLLVALLVWAETDGSVEEAGMLEIFWI
jgi:prepilin-type processing-associated H-X9-DG protein